MLAATIAEDITGALGRSGAGGKSGFEKETDTLDGWFDSGSTHYASMKRDQNFWPADMYLEGLDQYRGWFQSSLLTAVGAFGNGAPFKECVTHGWTVDGEGKAMHKSLGNGMDPAEIFNKYGADLLRLWAGSSDYHVDVRCSDEIFKQLSQNYLKFRNTAKFCLDNLVGFDADHLVEPGEMLPLDKWAITRLNDLLTKAYAAYDNYEFHVVSHMINDFCVVDLSSFYFDIIKDRLYCGEENSLERRSAQSAVWMILDAMTRLFAPILAFTCDEVWLAMPHRAGDDARNVLLNQMVQPYAAYALSEEEMGKWARLAALRTAVNGALEQARAAADEAALQAADAKAALEQQQTALADTQTALEAALLDANSTLTAQQAAAQAQAAVTDAAKKAYEDATAALDAYVREQSRRYTTADLHLTSLDFRCPLDSYGRITTQFAEPDPWGIPHRGTDFAAPGGTPIYAIADGVVSAARTMNSYGNCVQVSHGTADDGHRYDSLYAHMSSIAVAQGAAVQKGDLLGYVGNTGNVYGAGGGYHLHLELRVDGGRVDPLGFVPTPIRGAL